MALKDEIGTYLKINNNQSELYKKKVLNVLQVVSDEGNWSAIWVEEPHQLKNPLFQTGQMLSTESFQQEIGWILEKWEPG